MRLGMLDLFIKDLFGVVTLQLSCVDLRYTNLSDANLRGADLRGANLSDTNLSGANLSYADLKGADLSDADLSGADLRYADLRYTNLRYANLSGANLRGADLSDVDLSGVKGFILGLQRSDSYQFTLSQDNCSNWRVIAGCRNFSFKEYYDHIETYGCKDKKAETELILDTLQNQLKLYEVRS